MTENNSAKRIIIGSVLFLGGIMLILGIFITASMYMSEVTTWSNTHSSKLFSVIYDRDEDGAQGLALGKYFVSGIVLTILGLGILIIELINSHIKKLLSKTI